MIIILGAKIVFDAVYQVYGDPYSVTWSVAYNFLDYAFIASALMLVIFTVDGHKKLPKWVVRFAVPLKYVCHIVALGYWCYALIELTYLGDTYEEYTQAMTTSSAVPILIMAFIGFISYGFIFRHKTLKENFRWI